MEIKLKKLLLITLFLINSIVYGQENINSNNGIEISLEEKALIKDIETSTIQELEIWAKSLGLVTGGSIDALKRSLANYYNVKLGSKAENSSKKVITVNRAELSNYYTLESVDESVAEFEGRVEIIIDDKEKEIQHSIIANKVNFNRTLNSVTALGNVEYTKTEAGKPEIVTAESMTFNISNWKGSLIKCVSRQDKKINKEEMTFYYVSGEIKKSDTEVMGMKNVTVQTVTGSPYFNISALDLWMLDSSDFLMVLPRINVGHVPVFIAPFYYHSENNLYFNPAFGIKTREGTILQNTIYLVGRKQLLDEESDFSFLSFDNGEGITNYELNGLSIVPNNEKIQYSKDFSKLMIDYYSNLGLFIGNTSLFNFNSIKSKIEFDGGIAFSRNINSENGEIFINNESQWNSSFYYEDPVPFRYLLNLKIGTPIVNIDYLNLSDTVFLSDFYNRQENFQWINYFTDQLNSGLDSALNSNEDIYLRDTTTIKEISTFENGIDFARFTPSVKILNPFIDKIDIDARRMKLEYNSKISENDYQTYDPSYKFFYPDKLTIPLTIYLKGRFFDTSFKANNEINDDKDIYTFTDPIFEITNPVVTKTEEKDKVEAESSDIWDIKGQEIFSNGKLLESANKYFSTSLDYNFTLPLNVYGYWDNDEWVVYDDINYDLENSDLLVNFDPTSTLTYNLDFFNTFFLLKDTLKDQLYLKRYLEDDEQKNLLDIYKWNKNTLNNTVLVQFDILKLFPEIKDQSLKFKYDLVHVIYKDYFDYSNYEEGGNFNDYYISDDFKWDKDFIEKNELSSDYTIKTDFSKSQLGYIHKLPPYDEDDTVSFTQNFDFNTFTFLNNKSDTTLKYNRTRLEDEETKEKITEEIYTATQKYTLSIAGIETSALSGFKYSESFINIEEDKDEWEFDPLTLNLGYKYKEKVGLKFLSEYSIEDEEWQKYSGEIKVFGLAFGLNSIYAQPVSWDMEKLSWVTNSEDEKILSLDNITVKHDFELVKARYWKNRILLNVDSELIFKKAMIKVDESKLQYTLKFNIDIYDFLTLNIASSSLNNTMYQYWEDDYNLLGVQYGKDLFSDLIKSFNFFSDDDRKESSFNLNSLKVSATYKMPDWDLLFEYKGEPKLVESKYEWYQVFSLFVEWKPLSLIRSDIKNDDDNWTVSTSAKE
ncbi:MAG: hypothetical protein JXR64_09345 [Spirochaetales bacterium]|nr:hypothetical protein [Spirochaetales bacterium]